MKKVFLLLLVPMFYTTSAFSQLFDGKTQRPASIQQLVDQVGPGSIVLLGENHGLAAHQQQHVEVLQALRAKGLKVSVGLEFLNYTDQAKVNDYRLGLISEANFLSQIQWGGISFDFYRPQLNFPDINEGALSLGLNLPRDVSSQISKSGLASLSEAQLAVLPPQFELGRDSYRARFMEAAGHHCKSPQNCFVAQCAWDDTMAWQAINFSEAHPDQVLVIVVGEFHVQYGGGLPYRIQSRWPQAKIVTLSQLWADGYTDDEIANELKPSEVEGPRADFIWVSRP